MVWDLSRLQIFVVKKLNSDVVKMLNSLRKRRLAQVNIVVVKVQNLPGVTWWNEANSQKQSGEKLWYGSEVVNIDVLLQTEGESFERFPRWSMYRTRVLGPVLAKNGSKNSSKKNVNDSDVVHNTFQNKQS